MLIKSERMKILTHYWWQYFYQIEDAHILILRNSEYKETLAYILKETYVHVYRYSMKPYLQ